MEEKTKFESQLEGEEQKTELSSVEAYIQFLFDQKKEELNLKTEKDDVEGEKEEQQDELEKYIQEAQAEDIGYLNGDDGEDEVKEDPLKVLVELEEQEKKEQELEGENESSELLEKLEETKKEEDK